MKCPKCNKPVIGQMNNFCRHCMYTFDKGGDRWYTLDDEEIPFKVAD
ncbi:hypothetical protein KY309_00395 [Candidatus Woesearchaeota archaeon]|nr:hypothetical protein [Candidatus Woesearchaeota archaeon]MBW3016052.1 hypothetical protein [Candidatus Woesearchaeota archaeon]